jgi:Arc/MetJ family transcription regulator
MTKRLIEIDDVALDAARLKLGTDTIKDTVNESLRRTAGVRQDDVTHALDALAANPLDDRSDAWR